MKHFSGVAVTAEEGKDGLKEVSSEPISFEFDADPATLPAGKLAKVTFGVGLTINTGNYENVRPMVQVEIACPVSEIDRAYDLAMAWVDTKLTALREGIEGAAK